MLVIVPIILNLSETACTFRKHKYLKYLIYSYSVMSTIVSLEKNKVISHPGIVLRIKSYST